MAVFLCIHARYSDVQIGIFKDEHLLEVSSIESKKVTKHLILEIDALLKKIQLTLKDLSFIAVHQGPAPYTSLRITLATVNAFAFVTGIPLVGINGLQALINKYKNLQTSVVALLNAFGQEVYYGIYDKERALREDGADKEQESIIAYDITQQTIFKIDNDIKLETYGVGNAQFIIEKIAQELNGPITFIGNGSELYKDVIKATFQERAYFIEESLIDIETLGTYALHSWRNQNDSTQLLPVYFK